MSLARWRRVRRFADTPSAEAASTCAGMLQSCHFWFSNSEDAEAFVTRFEAVADGQPAAPLNTAGDPALFCTNTRTERQPM